jgi:hypothetical protein
MLNKKAKTVLSEFGWKSTAAYLLEEFPSKTDAKILALAESKWANKLNAHKFGLNVAPCGPSIGSANYDGERKLKLLMSIPTGSIITSNWLKMQNISNHLSTYYCDTGYLKRIFRGYFSIPGTEPSIGGIMYALGSNYHLGGVSALEQYGMAHFIPLGNTRKIWIWGRGDHKPIWINKLKQPIKVIISKLMISDVGILKMNFFNNEFLISSPIRAMIEFLDDIKPTEHEYEHARLLMENLAFESPEDVKKHLDACSSVKVKRLFLHLADCTGVPWFSKLDINKINIGSGKRVWFQGGTLSLYKITVPKIHNNIEK